MACREFLQLFTNKEIMRWKELCQTYEQELRNVAPGSSVFSPKTDEGNKRWKDLKVRVVEHVSKTCRPSLTYSLAWLVGC